MSDKHGTQEWIWSRITSIGGVVLLPWFLYSMLGLIGEGAAGFAQWLTLPINAFLMSAFTIVFYFHAKLGIKIIVEDYVHDKNTKMRALVALELLAWAGILVTLFSVLKIALTAGAA